MAGLSVAAVAFPSVMTENDAAGTAPLSVMAGLDQATRPAPVPPRWATAIAWVAGSSPAMTER